MGKEYYVDRANNRADSRETKSDDEVKSAVATAKMSTLKGAGITGNAGRTPMPKQADYPDPAGFAAAMRRWRDAQRNDPDTIARKKALQ